MIKWVGKDATKRMCWTASADNYKELYHILIDKGVINYDDLSPYQAKQLAKAGLKVEDFADDHALNDALAELPPLSEEEIRLVIYHTDDVAQHQEFIEAESF
ncbi:hypothetical protein [Ignavigranum ruoffiae]|uniref:hypothetical protein n=1 Tax=Ignavigranum ruoffiae TaxID=89093 RepID=UPI0024AD11AB|nr:hypothetical protein [Ignavigranum ruoffiae]